MRRRTVIVVAVVFLAAASLRAQMIDCQPQSLTDYTIFVDDFRPSDPVGATEDVKRLVGNMQSAIRTQLEALTLEPDAPLQPVDCSGRFPKGSDFVRDQVTWLDNNRVVMELWAMVRPTAARQYDADFNIAVIPARRIQLDQNDPPGIFRIAHHLSGSGQGNLSAIVGHHRELTAYAFLGAGLRAKSAGPKFLKYAVTYLCKGVIELRQAPQTNDNKKLLAYAETAKQDAIAQARKASPLFQWGSCQ